MNARMPLPMPERAKLRAQDFWLLARSGAFDRYVKSELIEGEIWVMSAIHSWHAKTVAYFTTELTLALRQLKSEAVVFTSGSVDLSPESVPEPDVSVAEDHDGDAGLPLDKVRLAVEVADSTRVADLGRKAALYARHGLPEYWVASREDGSVFQHWLPTAEGFAKLERIGFGGIIEARSIEGLRIRAPLA